MLQGQAVVAADERIFHRGQTLLVGRGGLGLDGLFVEPGGLGPLLLLQSRIAVDHGELKTLSSSPWGRAGGGA